jgi:hypothetical protein
VKSEKNTSKKSNASVRYAAGKPRTYITKVKEERTYQYHPLSWRYAELVTPKSTTIQLGQEKTII